MQQTNSSGHMHFSGSNADTVLFKRPAFNLLLTVATGVTLSFDGGTNFMTMTAGTYNLPHINTLRLDFGGTGAWSGVGLSY